jgi:DNA-binding CsgD family transcriptional regulator
MHVLRLAGEAREHPDPASFRAGVLPGIRGLVDSDVIAYNEVDVESGTYYFVEEPFGALDTDATARLVDLAHEHPVIARNRLGDLAPHTISDFLSVRAFHRLALYAEMFRMVGAEDQLAFGLPGDVTIGIAMNRSSRSFTARDRAVLDLLRPHLAKAWQEVQERERANALVGALERGFEEEGCAVVLLDGRGRIEHASDFARELLEAYGGGSGVPADVEDWLGAEPDPDALTVEGPRGSLRVRALPRPGAPGSLTLLLTERRSSPLSTQELAHLGLSGREAQVLRLVARGADNAAIAADLGIATNTVRKHLERVYSKLGVHTRTEAAAFALGSRPPA